MNELGESAAYSVLLYHDVAHHANHDLTQDKCISYRIFAIVENIADELRIGIQNAPSSMPIMNVLSLRASHFIVSLAVHMVHETSRCLFKTSRDFCFVAMEREKVSIVAVSQYLS